MLELLLQLKICNTDCFSVNKIFLHHDQGYIYYKVQVANGLRLVEGQVPKTCAEAGMKAVCDGTADCNHSDTSKCLVTPLSKCRNAMWVTEWYFARQTHPLLGTRCLRYSVNRSQLNAHSSTVCSATRRTGLEGNAALSTQDGALVVKVLSQLTTDRTMHTVSNKYDLFVMLNIFYS